jgi:hypothetical protein
MGFARCSFFSSLSMLAVEILNDVNKAFYFKHIRYSQLYLFIDGSTAVYLFLSLVLFLLVTNFL